MGKTIFLLLFSSSLLLSQNKPDTKKNTPPGFEWVKKRGLLISTNEINTSQWMQFMLSMPDNGVPVYLPQTNAINKKCISYTDDLGDVNLNDPNEAIFRDTIYQEMKNGKPGKKRKAVERCTTMPITGISIDQAEAYCKWLNEQMAVEYPDLDLTFRLPTPREMDDLLKDTFSDWTPDLDNYQTYKNGINVHGCAIYNHAHNSWCDNNIDLKNRYGYGVPMEGSLFFPDMNGLFDLMGNVAELTSDEGIAKGGSCKDPASSCQPGAVNLYDGPQWWLGFRVVADLN